LLVLTYTSNGVSAASNDRSLGIDIG
jgi:hypothetical protein